jgi:hypothetical protein
MEGDTPMAAADRDQELDVKKLYEDQQVHGKTSRGLCIADVKVHERRLHTAGFLYGLLPSRSTILDVGCGFGDLLDYLPKGVNYAGADMTQWIVDAAREAHPEHPFHHKSLAELAANTQPRYDVVASLGVITTATPTELPLMLAQLRGLARRHVLVSWQLKGLYEGSFHAYSEKEVGSAFSRRLASVITDTEVTCLYEV